MVRTAAEAAVAAMHRAETGEPLEQEPAELEQPNTFMNSTQNPVGTLLATDGPEDPSQASQEPLGDPPSHDQALNSAARQATPLAQNQDLGDFIEVSGLLSYDPAAITRIYAGHPQRLIRRLWQTLVPIGLYLLGVLFDWFTGLLKDRDRGRQRARECAELLADLGPAFIKAGQALSTRPDIIPPLLLEELAQLQDQLPGFDSGLAMACIEDDLGAPVDQIYAHLEREPISAASLGQVHRGVLLSGEKVAVKVQRPGLREQITLDLYIVRNIAAWLNQNIGLIRSDLVALIDELGKRVFEEMDYLNEAANQVNPLPAISLFRLIPFRQFLFSG